MYSAGAMRLAEINNIFKGKDLQAGIQIHVISTHPIHILIDAVMSLRACLLTPTPTVMQPDMYNK